MRSTQAGASSAVRPVSNMRVLVCTNTMGLEPCLRCMLPEPGVRVLYAGS
jgi:hypothetical protein